MSTLRRRFPLPVTIALAGALLVTAPLLSGCSLIGGVVNGATGGGVSVPGQSVPKDFPSEVPLIDGDVQLGIGLGDGDSKVWNVTIKVDGIDAYQKISDQLTGAGFESSNVSESADQSTGVFTMDPYGVLVLVSSTDDGWSANYTVSKTDSGSN